MLRAMPVSLAGAGGDRVGTDQLHRLHRWQLATEEARGDALEGGDQDRFGATPWSTGEAGAPILGDSLGVFECERFAVYDGGDHHILVGEVVKASFDAALDPLLFFRGRYRRLHFD